MVCMLLHTSDLEMPELRYGKYDLWCYKIYFIDTTISSCSTIIRQTFMWANIAIYLWVVKCILLINFMYTKYLVLCFNLSWHSKYRSQHLSLPAIKCPHICFTCATQSIWQQQYFATIVKIDRLFRNGVRQPAIITGIRTHIGTQCIHMQNKCDSVVISWAFACWLL